MDGAIRALPHPAMAARPSLPGLPGGPVPPGAFHHHLAGAPRAHPRFMLDVHPGFRPPGLPGFSDMPAIPHPALLMSRPPGHHVFQAPMPHLHMPPVSPRGHPGPAIHGPPLPPPESPKHQQHKQPGGNPLTSPPSMDLSRMFPFAQGLNPQEQRILALGGGAQRSSSPASSSAHQAFPVSPIRACISMAGGKGEAPGVVFNLEDLDMVLYGYARTGEGRCPPGHALSGLKVGELSYGIDRILRDGGGSPGPASSTPSSKSTTAPTPPTSQVDPATLDVPEGLSLYQNTFAGTIHYGIYCKKSVIPKGTKFGPFQGKVVNTSEIKTNDDNTHMWEIFDDGKLSHFVDGRGSCGNWMSYVNTARYAQEQNLVATQEGTDIFYEVCKDVPQGTELLVWYGETYLQFMGIPVALKEMTDMATEQELEKSEGFQCERCGKVFAYKYYRDKHLKYTRCVDQGDRKFKCHLCSRSFEKRDRLRIHILHVHEKHRPHKCTVCGKSFSQSSSLNKHMRVHSGERPYKCVYCSKAFTASSILRTHIRQHSGEKPFKCKHCGKAFASHAAHDSHVRRTHSKAANDRGNGGGATCTICGRGFSQIYELKFHMRTHELDDSGNSSFGDINMNDKGDGEIDVVGMDMMM